MTNDLGGTPDRPTAGTHGIAPIYPPANSTGRKYADFGCFGGF